MATPKMTRLAQSPPTWTMTRQLPTAGHPGSGAAAVLARTKALATHLSIAYDHILEWALAAPQRLLDSTPLEQLFLSWPLTSNGRHFWTSRL